MERDLGAALRDPGRLGALRRLGVLDTAREETFDRLTRLATRVIGCPVSLVSLVDDDRQWFKSAAGLPDPSVRETPLSHSFCQHVVASGEPLVITDARIHPDLAGNLAIPELGVVAYAGIPLITEDGHVLGSFCVIDTEPRVWTVDELDVLQDLADAAARELTLRWQQTQLRMLVDAVEPILWQADPDAIEPFFVSASLERLLGVRPAEVLGRASAWASLVHPADRHVVERTRAQVAADGGHATVTFRAVGADGRVVWLRETIHLRVDDVSVAGTVIGIDLDVTVAERAERRLLAQQEAAAALVEVTSLEEAGAVVLAAIGRGADWEVGVAWMVEDGPGGGAAPARLRSAATWVAPHRSPGALVRGDAADDAIGIAQLAARTGRAFNALDLDDHPVDDDARWAAAVDEDLHAVHAYPVHCSSQVVAVLELWGSGLAGPDDDVTRMVDALASQMAQCCLRFGGDRGG